MGAAYQNILLEIADGIATLTLNRPEKLNAYTLAMGDEIVDAFARIRADDAARVVILTGAGRGFCAGVDLDALKAHQASEARSELKPSEAVGAGSAGAVHGRTASEARSEPKASGAVGAGSAGAVHGRTASEARSEPKASGAVGAGSAGAVHGRTASEARSEPKASGAVGAGSAGAVHGRTASEARSEPEASGGGGAGFAGAVPARLGEEDFLRVLPLELLEFPKPVIAAINGAAIGVGVTMTLPCDIRIAADTAKLGLTFAKLGLLPGLGSTHLLPRLVGPAKALELVLTARVIPAAEAAEIGLVNRIVPAASLRDEARALATAMLESRPEVLAAAKAALRLGASASMAESMQNERDASAKLRAALRR